MKRLLILSYYFPPFGLSGVQRTVKFIKYLPQYGWNSLVVTPHHRGSYVYDHSLDDEVGRALVYRTYSLDPLFLSPTRPQPASVSHGRITQAVNQWLIPDNKLGWVPYAVMAALKVSRRHAIDVIYSTAPPYSSHLAAVIVKRVLNKPLVTDFRDAWTGYTWTKYPTSLHLKLDLALERTVLKNSDLVLGVNEKIIAGLRESHPSQDFNRYFLVPHGYDPEDFCLQKLSNRNCFRITHSGTFIKNRSPRLLLEALTILRRRQPRLFDKVMISFAGALRNSDTEMINRSGLADKIEMLGYLPHRKSVELLMHSDLLWLVMGPEETANVTPGKLFEYLGARKPILATVPDGAAAKIINQTGSGVVVPTGDATAMAEALENYLIRWEKGLPLYWGKDDILKSYDRSMITGIFARLLDGLV